MTIDETADALELSPASVKRHWTTARAWLARELSAGAPDTRDTRACGEGRRD
jgi:hypothetical protein